MLHYIPACERKEKEPQAKESVDGEKSTRWKSFGLIFLAYEWKCLVDDDAGGKVAGSRDLTNNLTTSSKLKI